MRPEAKTRATASATAVAIDKARENDGVTAGIAGADPAGFISLRKGGARMERPTMPRMQASEGMFLGRGELGLVPRSKEVHARSSV